MNYCHQCGSKLILESAKFCPNCGFNFDGKMTTTDTNNLADNTGSIHIHNNNGEIWGVGVTGSNNSFTSNKTHYENNPINIDKSELDKIPEECSNALRNFINDLNNKIKGNQVPEEKVKEVNDTINDFVKDVQVTNPEDKEKVDLSKKEIIGNKFKKMVKVALKILPAATAIASVASFGVHLAPFSGLIGESVHNIIETNFNNR